MDQIEMLDHALVHHGSFNERLYLLKFPQRGTSKLIRKLVGFAREKGYGKIIAKVPKGKLKKFLQQGFKMEACIPRFYLGHEDCCFVSLFLLESRAVVSASLFKKFQQIQNDYRTETTPFPEDDVIILRKLEADDIPDMVSLFRKTFTTYPFPIHDPGYLRETMRSHVEYFGVRRAGELIALASSEMDPRGLNVEMTDFATLPAHRGLGLGTVLLREMERAMTGKGMLTAYTIARAVSPGMNITFARLGYRYAGTLVNNTQISGGIESMNVWYRKLR